MTSRFAFALLALALAPACSRTPTPAAAPASAAAKPGAEGAAPAAAATETTGAAPAAAVNANGVPRAVGPVATVNGRDIGPERFNAEFERLVGRSTKVPADRMRKIATNVLNRLIDQELREQAIRNENITLTDAEFDDAWKDFTARFRKGDGHFDEAALNAELQRAHTTLEQMREQIRQQRLGAKLVQKLGGQNRVTSNNQWRQVAKRLGFETNWCVNQVRVCYKRYLQSFEELYRTLGCTLVNHPRGNLRYR